MWLLFHTGRRYRTLIEEVQLGLLGGMGHAIGCLGSKPVFPTQTTKTTYDFGLSSSSAALQTNCSLDQLKSSIRVPLTEREVFTITKSWKTISRNMTHTGIAMFLR